MPYTPPVIDIEACTRVINACLKALVEDICEKHIEAAKAELDEKLPEAVGNISARLLQEVPKGGTIQPHFSINILTNKETT
jgi:hypothetical protein